MPVPVPVKESTGTEEFQTKNFGLEHETPRIFVEPQYGGPSLAYVIYRVAVAVYFIAFLIYSAVVYPYGYKWLIFLTFWTYTLITLNALLQAIYSGTHYYKVATLPKDVKDVYTTMPLAYKIFWVLQNITYTMSPLITIFYWSVVYEGWPIDPDSANDHIINSIYIFIDLAITGIPVRLLHFYQPMTYAAIYAVFAVIYDTLGGTSYDGQHYFHKLFALGVLVVGIVFGIIVVVLLLVPCVHGIHYCLYLLRVHIYEKCCKREVEEEAADLEMFPDDVTIEEGVPNYGSISAEQIQN